ncbi:helix-turn-helix domain-containing protein [Caulobacter sp. SLTY]|uniref:helix-turn-helix domain-containing protein n=1 Tax=Caulobacter sp. SLTY TaxID=2683262 RepID=UPI0014128F15|nr:helix-turn-helix transcriptional regulator [Caulobacter sp. SLTY]NBB15157.1 helix-turn-helix domain-containing protein [Caulobacter sp. SLTY]
MDWCKIFGENVRSSRLQAGLTQEELAADGRIDVTYLRGIEAGRRNPSLRVIGRLAAALGTDPAHLVAAPLEP